MNSRKGKAKVNGATALSIKFPRAKLAVPFDFSKFPKETLRNDMKLTKEQVEKMLPGQTLTVVCNDASELNSSYEIAKRTRRESGFSPEDFPIACSTKTMTVVLRRLEKGGA